MLRVKYLAVSYEGVGHPPEPLEMLQQHRVARLVPAMVRPE